MGILTTHNTNNEKKNLMVFVEHEMVCYILTSIDPNVDNESIQYSNYFEEGKSDLVLKRRYRLYR